MDIRLYDIAPRFGENPTPIDQDAPDHDRRPATLGWCSTLTTLALLTVMARMYVLAMMSRAPGVDDVTIGIAVVSLLSVLPNLGST